MDSFYKPLRDFAMLNGFSDSNMKCNPVAEQWATHVCLIPVAVRILERRVSYERGHKVALSSYNLAVPFDREKDGAPPAITLCMAT
jgi:hypothetical protein